MTITSKTGLVIEIERNKTVSGICRAGEFVLVTYRSRRSAAAQAATYRAFGLAVTVEQGKTIFISA